LKSTPPDDAGPEVHEDAPQDLFGQDLLLRARGDEPIHRHDGLHQGLLPYALYVLLVHRGLSVAGADRVDRLSLTSLGGAWPFIGAILRFPVSEGGPDQ
jgi:hypothetical protein